MDGPPPPIDDEQRNIIDKLAVFVVKNGLEFEEMTRQKQVGNPRFAFLFGGEYSQYYQYRLACENAAAAAGGQMQSDTDLVQSYEVQIEAMKKQLADSERNLKAQYDSLMLQQQAQVDAAIEKLENEKISNLMTSASLNVEPFSVFLDQLIQNCTKENISNCKHWIMENCKTDRLREVLLMYTLHRVKDKKATDQGRLHILYLMNDWAHNCMRRKMEAITQMLSRYVPQLYAIAVHTVNDSGCRDKLDKLMALWESQKYFDDNAYKQLRNPAQTYSNGQTAKIGEYQKMSAEIAQKVQATYQQYKQQHQEYEKHVEQQISTLQFSVRHAQSSKRRSRFDQTLPSVIPQQLPPQQQQQAPLPPRMPPPLPLMAVQTRPPPRMALMGNSYPDYPPSHDYDYEGPPTSGGPPMMWHGPPPMGARPPMRPPFVPSGPPPAGFGPQRGPPPGPWPPRGGPWGGPPIQSHSGPGPGYPTPPMIDESKLVPTVEYYDLPAGLMAPLVRIEDCDYLPLNPKDLRLPPPIPPSERLVMAMEAFYSSPTHDNPRDAEGWEKLGLYEFYKAKGQAKQEASERVKTEQRSPEHRRHSASRSPSPPEIRPEIRDRRRRSRSRSKSRSPSPDFSSKQVGFQPMTVRSGPIGHDNRGHQLMTKMGWQGGGLGADEQGREDPVDGGEVRDKVDQYKGLGTQEDGMFDQFRKQKSGAFQARFQRK